MLLDIKQYIYDTRCFKDALNIHSVTEKLKNMFYLDHKGQGYGV